MMAPELTSQADDHILTRQENFQHRTTEGKAPTLTKHRQTPGPLCHLHHKVSIIMPVYSYVHTHP